MKQASYNVQILIYKIFDTDTYRNTQKIADYLEPVDTCSAVSFTATHL
jgi:hypothetical protein